MNTTTHLANHTPYKFLGNSLFPHELWIPRWQPLFPRLRMRATIFSAPDGVVLSQSFPMHSCMFLIYWRPHVPSGVTVCCWSTTNAIKCRHKIFTKWSKLYGNSPRVGIPDTQGGGNDIPSSAGRSYYPPPPTGEVVPSTRRQRTPR